VAGAVGLSPFIVSDRPKPSTGNVIVVLGPTNTGKTHFAVERMLGHFSGLTGDSVDGLDDFDRDLVSAVEEHRFPPLRLLQWRNAALNFSSVTNLIGSLEAASETTGLARGLEASDLRALKNIAARPETNPFSKTPHNLRRLWDTCQIPDFRKISPDDHTSLVWDVFCHISAAAGILSNDWMARHLSPVDRVDGDIDSLAQRIAHVRTLTYIANRADWLDDPKHWQGLTAGVEDRLSDALHERLSQRFIDRRTSVLMRALGRKDRLVASVMANGEIVVEDQYVGRLEGFRFFPDEGAHDLDDKAVSTAAEQALGREIATRARAFVEAPDGQISLKIADDMSEPSLLWQGHLLARLKKGSAVLRPDFDIISTPLLVGEDRLLVEDRLRRWLDATISQQLQPLFRLQEVMDKAEELAGLARGIAFQVYENLGSLPRRRVAQQLKEVDKDGRRQLRQTGLWLGAISLYLPALLKPQAARLRAQLWALDKGIEVLPVLPKPGLITAVADPQVDGNFYEMAGYRAIGDIAVRLDMLERLFLSARVPAEKGPFPPDANMMSLVGCSGAIFEKIMSYLGYSLVEVDASAIPAPEIVKDIKVEAAPVETASEAVATGEAATGPEEATPEGEVEETLALAEAAPDAAGSVEAGAPETAVEETSDSAAVVAEVVVEVVGEGTAETVAAEVAPLSDASPLKVMAFVRSNTIRPIRPPRPRREPRPARPVATTPPVDPSGEAVKADVADRPARHHHPRRSKPARRDNPRSEPAKQPPRQPEREPVFDATSPFAVLMELRKSMAAKK
jgi:ATP-dependent RNA helicase SUPV3L1/SUV3